MSNYAVDVQYSRSDFVPNAEYVATATADNEIIAVGIGPDAMAALFDVAEALLKKFVRATTP